MALHCLQGPAAHLTARHPERAARRPRAPLVPHPQALHVREHCGESLLDDKRGRRARGSPREARRVRAPRALDGAPAAVDTALGLQVSAPAAPSGAGVAARNRRAVRDARIRRHQRQEAVRDEHNEYGTRLETLEPQATREDRQSDGRLVWPGESHKSRRQIELERSHRKRDWRIGEMRAVERQLCTAHSAAVDKHELFGDAHVGSDRRGVRRVSAAVRRVQLRVRNGQELCDGRLRLAAAFAAAQLHGYSAERRQLHPFLSTRKALPRAAHEAIPAAALGVRNLCELRGGRQSDALSVAQSRDIHRTGAGTRGLYAGSGVQPVFFHRTSLPTKPPVPRLPARPPL